MTIPTKRFRRVPLWDGFTIGLAAAVAILGAILLFMPRHAESPRSKAAPARTDVPSSMALQGQTDGPSGIAVRNS